MKYFPVVSGIFRSRPNRFIAYVQIEGKEEKCHVKNTGRCKELLIPGTEVFLQKASNPNRSTAFDVIAVKKGNLLINIDSQIPNKVVAEWLAATNYLPGLTLLKPETTFGTSRFDFYYEQCQTKGFIEVKGVTLEQDGLALFPDAPTLRGIKHLQELALAKQQGYEAMVVFVIQMKGVHSFTPNDATHPAFGDALREAKKQGVTIIAIDCNVTPDEITGGQFIPVLL